MRNGAKFACPVETGREWPLPILSRALESQRAVLIAAPGYVPSDSLAAAARARSDSVMWARLDPSDSDPASLIAALQSAADQALCAAPLSVDPVVPASNRSDWEAVYREQGRQLASRLPAQTVIILENVHHLVGVDRTHQLLGRSLLPALGDRVTVLMTAHRPLARRRFRRFAVYTASDLAVGPSSFATQAKRAHASLTGVPIRRTVRLTGGRVLALSGVLLASSVFGAAFVADAVKKSRSTTELLARLAASLVGSIDTEARGSLALAALFGYSHPRLFEAVLGPRPVPDDPWLVPLSDDWSQVRTLWREPLLDLLRSQVTSSSGLLTRLADVLLQQGMAEDAVPLYLQAGDLKGAIRALPRAVETLAAAGRWNAMARLVAELPCENGTRHGGQAHWTAPSLVRIPTPHLRHRDIAPGRPHQGRQTATDDGHPTLLDARTSRVISNRSAPPSQRPMTAHLLGSFRVAIDDHAVERWTSGRGRTVLRFLLLRHPEAVHREVLMDTFWPDASPEGARNNLNVAIHGLRQSLRAAAGDEQIVIHDRGRYLLSRDLVVWLDTAEFERLLSEAAAREADGDSTAAIESYAVATGLYSRGLFADDPYDDWVTTSREHYRVMQIDALDRLARIYFTGGDHTACIRTCQQILGLDGWREDTHCVLMRCFSRLGQPHLAIHQYRLCAAELGRELQVTPAPSTIELFEAVRLRQPI